MLLTIVPMIREGLITLLDTEVIPLELVGPGVNP